jgi:hypothetical protein
MGADDVFGGAIHERRAPKLVGAVINATMTNQESHIVIVRSSRDHSFNAEKNRMRIWPANDAHLLVYTLMLSFQTTLLGTHSSQNNGKFKLFRQSAL